MFSKNHFINIISLVVVSTIYIFLFNSKYEISYFYSLIFAAVTLSFVFLLNKFNKAIPSKIHSKLHLVLVVILILITTLLLYFVPNNQYDIFLDSFNSWLSYFFAGTYPYQPDQVFTGFPLLYFFGVIFFITGQSILFFAAGISLILFFILKNSKLSNEFFVRLFLFSLLTFLCLIFKINLIPFLITAFPLLLIYLIENEKLTIHSSFSRAVLGMIAGLFLSVHFISSAIIIFYLYFFLRQDLKAMLKVLSISIFVFILTLLPFALWDWERFYNLNPLMQQLNELNFSMFGVILIALVALLAGWMMSDTQEFYFTTGLILFMIAVYNFSSDTTYINYSRSFFLYPALFLIFSIKYYKVDRFLGKVLKT